MFLPELFDLELEGFLFPHLHHFSHAIVWQSRQIFYADVELLLMIKKLSTFFLSVGLIQIFRIRIVEIALMLLLVWFVAHAAFARPRTDPSHDFRYIERKPMILLFRMQFWLIETKWIYFDVFVWIFVVRPVCQLILRRTEFVTGRLQIQFVDFWICFQLLSTPWCQNGQVARFSLRCLFLNHWIVLKCGLGVAAWVVFTMTLIVGHRSRTWLLI